METTGAFIALTVAVLLLLRMRSEQDLAVFHWISAALISMGLFDLVHGVLRAGSTFVWMHSIATLAGGVLFSLVWLPESFARTRLAKVLPAGAAAATTIVGILAIAFPTVLPAAVSGDNFTLTIKTINFLGGLFFLAAAAWFLTRYRKSEKAESLLFASQSLLFGEAGLLFAQSKLWNADWWYWHLLRLLAYGVVLGYAFSVYYRLHEELRWSETRHRALLHAIPDSIFRFRLDGTLLDFQAQDGSLNLNTSQHMRLGSSIFNSPMPRHVVEQIMAASKQAVETGEVQTIEFSYPRASQVRDYEARIVASGSDELVTVVRNITQRKRAEDALRESKEELRALAGRLISVKEEESKRLARDLHDGFSQRLAGLGIEVAALRQELVSPYGSPYGSLQHMEEEIGRLAKEVHQLSRQLHPSILDDLGLATALRAECTAFTKQHGVAVEILSDDVPDSLPGDISLNLYRIAQESLWNVAKHSQALEVRLSLSKVDGDLILTVEDDGDGFDPEKIKGKGGLGLVSIEERARLIGGSFKVQSQPGKGTRVEVRIPLPQGQA